MAKQSSSNVERGAEILLALGNGGRAGMSLAEIAEAIGDAKSAVHRALTGLSHYGFVEQSGRRGNYRLGNAIYALAQRVPGIGDLVDLFRPALISVTAGTGISSFLMARSGFESVCLDFQLSAAPVQPLLSGVGGRLPLGIGHAGVCMIARLDKESRERILEINAPHYEMWKLDVDTIRSEIEMFLEKGYVIGTRKAAGYEVWTLAFAPAPGDNRYGETGVSLLALANSISDEEVQRCIALMTESLPYKWFGNKA
ncbi:DNA-binding IclR family transcriptional regulator [Agrobacterium larrymoorei]|uniref:DNA-binding IclR family transcriptional regulator n=1 Tax=Agrobacterium larrymoorei TaxID=160699 RepID=A0AAJ2BAX2_9HYPH|nr:helix-turn-helix domain-containing protein [Agrobacterium larrymoorei]MDR6101647.1 DNA-binding IclR family transcriptional regulator [Agrobacterium larrymoorei]